MALALDRFDMICFDLFCSGLFSFVLLWSVFIWFDAGIVCIGLLALISSNLICEVGFWEGREGGSK